MGGMKSGVWAALAESGLSTMLLNNGASASGLA